MMPTIGGSGWGRVMDLNSPLRRALRAKGRLLHKVAKLREEKDRLEQEINQLRSMLAPLSGNGLTGGFWISRRGAVCRTWCTPVRCRAPELGISLRAIRGCRSSA